MIRRTFVAAAIGLIVLSGCGGAGESTDVAPGQVRSGAELFDSRILGGNPGCVTCHSLDPGTELIGPSLAGIASRAATRNAASTAQEYIRESITAPQAFVVDGYTGRMPENWTEVLTADEIDALVAYLLTLTE
jgi:nitric oxide reductase subunit C